MASPYRLIVFDWDGTLMDSIATIVACAQESLRDLDLPPVADAAIRDAVGLRLDVIIRRLAPDQDDSLHEHWIERYRYHWNHTFRGRPQLLAGARQVVQELRHRGHWLAVATGKGRLGLDKDLRTTGLGPSFLATRTVDEAPSKPDPGMLLGILDELGVAAEEALMVGDSHHDLQMAANAGIHSVGVLTGSHDRATLLAHGPRACLDRAADLPAWLDRA